MAQGIGPEFKLYWKKKRFHYLFIYFTVLGLQSRHSTTLVTALVHLALVILEMGTHKLCLHWPQTEIFLISTS
jgi:hypothetical protein